MGKAIVRRASRMNMTAEEIEREKMEAKYSTELVGEKVQTFSVMTAMVNTSMLLLACLSLSLVTVFRGEADFDEDGMEDILLPVSRTCSIIIMLAYVAYIFFQLVTHREAMQEDEGGEEEEEDAMLSVPSSIMVMCTTTV